MFLKSKKIALAVLGIGLFFSACESEKLKPFGLGCDAEVSYTNEVLPIINARCVGCHYSGSGYSDFTAYEGLKAAADNNSIYTRVVVLKDMPQGGPALSDEETKIINCWLKQGALNN